MGESNSITRRDVIKSVSIPTGIGLISSASAQTSGSRSQAESPLYEVSGKKYITTRYTRKKFSVEEEYESTDLKDAIGREKFTKTKNIDRPQPYEDDAPIKGVKESTEPWHTYIATEAEWRIANQRDGMSIQHGHEPIEDQFCGIGVWDYQEVDHVGAPSDYLVKNPINVVTKGYGVDDVKEIFANEGWYTGFVAQWPRYAWDVDREVFCGESNQPLNEYADAASEQVGMDGRYHAKFWELEDGIVSIQAHEDTAIPHSVASYDNGRDRVSEVLESAGATFEERKNLENSKGDHSGSARVLRGYRDSVNRSC